MGKVDDYFDANEWPKTKEEAVLAKEVVDTVRALKKHAEKCKRWSNILQRARLELAAGRLDEAVVKLRELMDES